MTREPSTTTSIKTHCIFPYPRVADKTVPPYLSIVAHTYRLEILSLQRKFHQSEHKKVKLWNEIVEYTQPRVLCEISNPLHFTPYFFNILRFTSHSNTHARLAHTTKIICVAIQNENDRNVAFLPA